MKRSSIEGAGILADVVPQRGGPQGLHAANEDDVARAYKDGKSQSATSPNYTGRRLTVGLQVTSVVAFMTFASSTRSFAAKVNAQPSFTILVFSFRQVPRPILANAENEAGRIFERAGIHVTWRDCPTGDESCPKDAGPVFFPALMSDPVQNKVLGTVSGHAVATDIA